MTHPKKRNRSKAFNSRGGEGKGKAVWGNGSCGALRGAALGSGVSVGWAQQSSPTDASGNDSKRGGGGGVQLALRGDGGGEGVPKP